MSRLRNLALLAVVSANLYLAIALVSARFRFDSPTTERPIVLVLALFAAAFIVYLCSVRLAARAPQDRRLLGVIFGGAILFRLILLPSQPIQEIDIYRYTWDGAATNAGVSPFRYSPEQVRAAAFDDADEDLRRLVAQRDGNPALATILDRIHYGELPTVYPPTSQAVFAAATFITPDGAPVWLRLLIMKTWFVAFDLATLVLVVKLLQLAGKPVGLSLIYGWCPLLMKEVANSGHLDAVAVFLTTLGVYLAARLFVRHGSSSAVTIAQRWTGALAVAVVLGLAVGAKIYPIVLAPLLLIAFVRRLGWKIAAGTGIAFAATVLIVLWPMLPHGRQPAEATATQTTSDENNPSRGLTTFLRSWEMNDFIFLVVVENLKPTADVQPNRAAWFSIAPESFRSTVSAAVSSTFEVNPQEVPFLVTRAATGLAFLALAVAFAWRASRSLKLDDWLHAAFLTLAWFWLLCPTQNPWYWTWALPLLAFARNRAWLLLSGVVFLYYLRFWFGYHWPDTAVFGTAYAGHAFFDFVVTWLEFAPWFALLLVEYCRLRSARTADDRKPLSEAGTRAQCRLQLVTEVAKTSENNKSIELLASSATKKT